MQHCVLNFSSHYRLINRGWHGDGQIRTNLLGVITESRELLVYL